MTEQKVLLKVENLSKHFPITKGIIFDRTIGEVRAVDGISFEIIQGETLGLVGELGPAKLQQAERSCNCTNPLVERYFSRARI